MNTDPFVSIVCLTFNEKLYVRDCFEGFIMQETSFPFEILVYDDASTDGTQQIIDEYVKSYPSIFKATIYEENQFSKGEGFRGLREGFANAKGKYIAYCEGDDYWTDPHKLQKQVDFLDSHPQYEVCAHETLIRNDNNPKEDGTLFTHTNVNIFINRTKRNHYRFADTLTGNIFHISSMMFRNMEFRWPSWIKEIAAMDMVIFMLLAEKGDIYLLRDEMSVYRHNASSITSTQHQFSTQIAFNEASVQIIRLMDDYWEGRYHKTISKVETRYYVNSMFRYLSKGNINFSSAKQMAKDAVQCDVLSFLHYFIVESWEKLKKHI